jgi:hypothetical protein
LTAAVVAYFALALECFWLRPMPGLYGAIIVGFSQLYLEEPQRKFLVRPDQ